MLTEKEICSSQFLPKMAERYKAVVPYMRFITEAVRLPF